MESCNIKAQVVVCGGGVAGMIAAIASGRAGVNTLLIEKANCLGGTATSGLLSVFGPFDDGDRLQDWERDGRIEKGLPLTAKMKVGSRIIRGVAEEILERLVERGGAVDYGYGFIPVNPEMLKSVSEEMIGMAGVKVLYDMCIIGAVVQNGKIRAVEASDKSGIRKICGDIFVDSTGDADLSFFAGVPFKKGRETDGRMQGVTLMFRLGNVNINGRFFTDREQIEKTDRLFRAYYSKGKTSVLHHVGCISAIPGMKGVVAVNTQHTHNIDGTVSEELTRAAITGRRETKEIVCIFKKHLKGFEKCFLMDTASMVGVRETRRIEGRYTLTEDDILSARRFADSIGRNAYNLDIHLPDEHLQNIFLRPGTYYDIPYRCLLPVNVENLLVAGRCISSTHRAQSSIRIVPCCMVTGQAAGIAAALCAQNRILPGNIDIGLLQNTIVDSGGIV